MAHLAGPYKRAGYGPLWGKAKPLRPWIFPCPQRASPRPNKSALIEPYNGLLQAEDRLPSTRLLAQRWGIARGTLEAVFERLQLEGYILRQVGSGSRVSAVIPDSYLKAVSDSRGTARALGASASVSDKSAHSGADHRAKVGVPFVARLANPKLLAPTEWAAHLQRAMAGMTLDQMCNVEPQGTLALREQIARYLRNHRGIACQAEHLLITNGIRHGIDLVARCVLRPGDPALKSIDSMQRVIYCGSFNQALFSNLRLGYLIAPPQLHDQILTLWHTVGRSVGVSEQLGLAAFMRGPAFLRHLRRARQEYQGLRDILLETLQTHAAGCFRISGEHAGFHLILWLTPGQNQPRLIEAAKQAGILLHPLSQFCHQHELAPAFVLGFAALTRAQAKTASCKLAELLQVDAI